MVMADRTAEGGSGADFARDLLAASAVSATHPLARALRRDASPGPSLDRARADAVHFFALLHVRPPGAATTSAAADSHWATGFAASFSHERRWLADISLIAEPPRPSPDLGRHEALLRDLHSAMTRLVRLERPGAALGALAALAADWPALCAALAGAPLAAVPELGMCAAEIAVLAADPATARALRFGADQMAGVHRAVWDLVEARQAIRLPR